MKTIIIGHVCIDYNLSEHTSYIGPGGPAIFINKVYQQLPEVTTEVVAPYGSDFIQYAEGLRLYPSQPQTRQTLVYENKTVSGLRTQKAYFRKQALPVKVTPTVSKLIAECDVFFLAPLLPNFLPRYVKNLLAHSRSTSLKILIPQGYFRDFDSHNTVIFREFLEIKAILPLFEVMILSELDYPNLEQLAKEWSQNFNIIILITVSERGCLVVKAGEIRQISVDPVPPVEIVDSVGAGDIFSAAFAYAYFKDRRLDKAVEFANSIARQSLFYSSEELRITL